MALHRWRLRPGNVGVRRRWRSLSVALRRAVWCRWLLARGVSCLTPARGTHCLVGTGRWALLQGSWLANCQR